MPEMPSYLRGTATEVSEDTVRERVKLGIKLLDEKAPGWRESIDLEKLSMETVSDCVLGQLYGHVYDGCYKLGLVPEQPRMAILLPPYWDVVCDHGFGIKPNETCGSGYTEVSDAEHLKPVWEGTWVFSNSRFLTKIWREEIQGQKGVQSDGPATS